MTQPMTFQDRAAVDHIVTSALAQKCVPVAIALLWLGGSGEAV